MLAYCSDPVSVGLDDSASRIVPVDGWAKVSRHWLIDAMVLTGPRALRKVCSVDNHDVLLE